MIYNIFVKHVIKKLLKGLISCQAVSKKFEIFNLPDNLVSTRRLERVLVAMRILFKKVTIVSKGQSPKIRGAACNFLVENAADNCKTLPRPADSNGLIIVKLKRKVQYKSNVLFESVRPQVLKSLFLYLEAINFLYSGIQVNLENIPIALFRSGRLKDTVTK